MRAAFAGPREQYPDVRVTVEPMVAEGDTVAVRLTYTATDATTGERATWPEMVFTRFADGRAIESREVVDTGALPTNPRGDTSGGRARVPPPMRWDPSRLPNGWRQLRIAARTSSRAARRAGTIATTTAATAARITITLSAGTGTVQWSMP